MTTPSDPENPPERSHREISNANAERFYDALILLSSIRWCTFALANWQKIADARTQVETTIQTGSLGRTNEQMQKASAALGQMHTIMLSIPQTPEEWHTLDNCIRECLEALGVNLNMIPQPEDFKKECPARPDPA